MNELEQVLAELNRLTAIDLTADITPATTKSTPTTTPKIRGRLKITLPGQKPITFKITGKATR